MELEEDKSTSKEDTKQHKVYLTTTASISRNAKNEKTINEFTLGETIGKGGFSKVKMAKHDSDKCFAIKIMHKPTLKRERSLAYSPRGSTSMTNNLEKAYSEINTWSQLDHKNIIKLFEVIDDDTCDYLYLIMELADLGQIADWNREEHKYKRNEKIFNWVLTNKLNKTTFTSEQQKIEAVAKFLFSQITDGLSYLHSKNIIHHDIKPDNLLFTSKDIVKIADYTVARILPPGQDKCFDAEGTTAFTGNLLVKC